MGTLSGVTTNTTNVKKKNFFLREQILNNRTVDDIKELLLILLKWQCNYVRKCSYFSYFLEMYVRLI